MFVPCSQDSRNESECMCVSVYVLCVFMWITKQPDVAVWTTGCISMSGFIVYVCVMVSVMMVYIRVVCWGLRVCVSRQLTICFIFYVFDNIFGFFQPLRRRCFFLAQCSSCTMYFYENFYLTIADRGIYMYGCSASRISSITARLLFIWNCVLTADARSI